jgi:YihY family inner membrane protein
MASPLPAKLRRVHHSIVHAGELQPNGRRGFLLPSLRYVFTPEVHVYASSIAANALLSFFPFTIILLTVCSQWLHWTNAYNVILDLLRANLPAGSAFVIRNLVAFSGGRHRLQVISLVALFYTSSGVFLPLEIALNKVWGFPENRSLFRNQAVSFLLAVMAGVMALSSVSLATGAQSLVKGSSLWTRWPHLRELISRLVLEGVSFPSLIVIFFIIFYVLPNGTVSARRVIPGAIAAGLLTEGGKFVYVATLPLLKFREVYGPFTLAVTLLFWAFAGALIVLWSAHVAVHAWYPPRTGTSAGSRAV